MSIYIIKNQVRSQSLSEAHKLIQPTMARQILDRFFIGMGNNGLFHVLHLRFSGYDSNKFAPLAPATDEIGDIVRRRPAMPLAGKDDQSCARAEK